MSVTNTDGPSLETASGPISPIASSPLLMDGDEPLYHGTNHKNISSRERAKPQ